MAATIQIQQSSVPIIVGHIALNTLYITMPDQETPNYENIQMD